MRTSKLSMMRRARRRAALATDEPEPARPHRPHDARSRVFSLRRWVGAAAWPEALLRHEGGAEPPPRIDAGRAAGSPSMRMASARSARRSPGQGREEFALAVSGDAGDADDLARHAADEIDVRQGIAMQDAGRGRRGRETRSISRVPGRCGSGCARRRPRRRPSARRSRGRSRSRGSRVADDPAAAQDRRASGRGGAPPPACGRCRGSRSPPPTSLSSVTKQVLRLLRRQHGGRLVEDQQLRVLEQAAHDLDALALARRQGPDGAVRLQREAVVAG